jgi:hypothetical protein
LDFQLSLFLLSDAMLTGCTTIRPKHMVSM